ncbi:MAG: hypothetical protein AB8B63_06670 [Granulosicoccus sp.]
MIADSRDLAVLAQSADSKDRHLRGASRISRRRRSQRWWAKKFLEQSFSACMRFRYMLLLAVLTFVFISLKNKVLVPESSSAGWTTPSGVAESVSKSAGTSAVLPSGGQVVIDRKSPVDPIHNGTAPLVSSPAVEAENTDS